jgi:hypothetical protein
MNYYDARPLADGSGFHYTCRNDDRIVSVGYCREHEPHATAEEARACFARYLLDGWREESYGSWHGCVWEEPDGGGITVMCDTPTKKGLTTRPPLGHGYALCDEHRTFEHLKQLAPTDAGQITATY